ncbi:MAG: hypothetical protein BroJett029_23300 [Alphaproteobacteria bacterium]|nr:MAG: hypothetical protein BroJett029_23300 [Alphaproteobacteria bacterium]
MVTDDSVVDRRILVEARTLARRGYHVILLAGGLADGSRFERDGALCIERFSPSASEAMARIRVNWRKLGKREAFLAAWLWPVHYLRPELLWLRRRIGKSYRALQYLIARARGWKATRPVRDRLPSVLNIRERWIIDRLVFYRPDVIHAHDLPQLRACAIAKRILRVPLIYDAHELYPEIHTLTARQSAELAAQEQQYIRDADVVITVNHLLASEFARRYPIEPPTVIWNAIDPPQDLFSSSGRPTLRSILGIGEDRRILLYQGWMSWTRGLQDLVRALAKVDPAIHLVFLGYGDARDGLAAIARREGVADRVHFLAAVPPDEMLYLTATADAGIIPYQPTGLNSTLCSPNKLFEYIQAQLPIVANDLPFLREVIAGEGFGVVAPLCGPAGFAAAISAMFDMTQGGPARFKATLASRAPRYAWTSQGGELTRIYDRWRVYRQACADGDECD